MIRAGGGGPAALVLVGVLVSACGGGVTEPGSTQVGVVATVTGVPSRRPDAVATTQEGIGTSVDAVRVTKCYTNATASGGGQLLIKAGSSDRAARLSAYRPDGSLIGQVQNGGGDRYGGTVMPYQPYDPVTVTIRSSAGGSITVPTTPFQPES